MERQRLILVAPKRCPLQHLPAAAEAAAAVPAPSPSPLRAPTSQVLLRAGAGHALPRHPERGPQGSVPLLVQVGEIFEVG